MRISYRTKLAALLAVFTTLGLIPITQAQASGARADGFTSLCGALDSTHPATVTHVMFILFENKSYGSIVGSKSTPYINKTLISGCGLATNYHSYSHPSTPNYLALTSGAAQGKAASADCLPSGCPQSQESIFSQLSTAGQAWSEYAEAMPSNCYKKNYDNTTYVNADGSTGQYYYVRHAPPAYYTSSPVPGNCSSWDVPLGTSSSGNLLNALSPGSDGLPAFSFVTPGGCNDMHDCSVKVGDDWLKQWIPIIQQSAAYQSGQLVVFITSDEGTGSDKANGETCWDATHADSATYPSCHVATIVMSPYTAPGTTSGSYFNHLSLLGTAEDLLGLPRLPATEGYTGLESDFGL
jgi:phosphatidylinositol-3-phosphatase